MWTSQRPAVGSSDWLGDGLNELHDFLDLFERRVEPFVSRCLTLGASCFQRRMDCILDGGNPLDFPCLENDGVLETASLLALLRNSRINIARRGQSDLDREFVVILPYGGEGIGVDDARIVRFYVGCDGIRFRQFLVDRNILEHPAA